MNNILYTIIVILVLILLAYLAYSYFSKSSVSACNKTTRVPLKILSTDYKNNTIVDLLMWAANEHGSRPALRYKGNKKKSDWKTVSYLEYFDNANKFSKSLKSYLKLTKSDKPKVAIIGFNSPEWFYSHMGTMLSGGVSVGMYPTSDSKTCEYIINQAGIDALVVEDSKQMEKIVGTNTETLKLIIYYGHVKQEILDKIDIPTIKYLDFIRNYSNFTDYKVNIKPADIATIIYTSGTTGPPKGAVISHENVIDLLNNMILNIHTKSTIELELGERLVSYLPLNHIAAQLMDIYIPLTVLSTVYFARPDALKGSLGETLKDVKPTIFIGVPRVWEKMMDKINSKLNMGIDMASFMGNMVLSGAGLNKCKYAISAAAPISPHTREFFGKLGLELCNVYGMSETAGPIALSMPGQMKEMSVGRPLIDTKISENGEILVRGKSVFSGYYKNEKVTKESFTNDGWFKTGDIGALDDEGYLYITGRSKDLIITAGGENISPIPIEDSLSEHLDAYFEHIMVIGDRRKFLSVLLVPKVKSNGQLAEVFDQYDKNDLNSDSKLRDVISDIVSDVNNSAPSNANRVQKWLILNKRFEIGDEMTPTLKLRRLNIQSKYKEQIDKLYQES
jgi:long-chain-fatty-acid--CoA ligase ACSBG